MSVEDEKHKIDGDIQTITTIPSTQYVSGVREIDERCYTKWRIESTEIARGYGAVIYQTSGGKVARVTQFNVDKQEKKKSFYEMFTFDRIYKLRVQIFPLPKLTMRLYAMIWE